MFSFFQEINGKREFGSHGSLEVMGRHHPAHLPSSAMLPGGPVITGAASHLQVMLFIFSSRRKTGLILVENRTISN